MPAGKHRVEAAVGADAHGAAVQADDDRADWERDRGNRVGSPGALVDKHRERHG
jgi:hypothetical protein